MKNEHQEDEAPRGPLILMVPASNLVAVLSLDWLDGCNQAAVSAKTPGRNYLANPRRTPKDFSEVSQLGDSSRFRYGADNIRKLVVYTSGRIDHDTVNAGASRSEII